MMPDSSFWSPPGDPHIFSLTSGTDLYRCTSAPSQHMLRTSETLFGALVYGKAINMDVRLQIPNLDDEPGLRLPKPKSKHQISEVEYKKHSSVIKIITSVHMHLKQVITCQSLTA